jgi:hypothetical protein
VIRLTPSQVKQLRAGIVLGVCNGGTATGPSILAISKGFIRTMPSEAIRIKSVSIHNPVNVLRRIPQTAVRNPTDPHPAIGGDKPARCVWRFSQLRVA